MNKKLLWASRVFTGLFFAFSGLIKANDPLGFAYKLDEYFQIFGCGQLEPFSVAISIVICILEVMMGIWLLIGFLPVINAWALLLLIIFFDFLTGYTALANVAKDHPEWLFSKGMASLMNAKDGNPEFINALSDCGCFGDFIKLKPWQSFLKDVVLSVFIIYIFRNRNDIRAPFNKVISAMISFTTGLVSVSFPLICYYTLPYKDFLPYRVGNDLVKEMSIPPGAPSDSFEYRFVLIREGYRPAIHDFRVYDNEGTEVTEIFTERKGYKLVVVAYQLEKAGADHLRRVSKIISNVTQSPRAVTMFLVTGTDLAMAEAYLQKYQLTLPAYQMDGTVLKTMMRANPGIMLLKDARILKKWSGNVAPLDTTKIFKYLK
jgi:uncharacterized membrane protein YphA (DoxX/SURF4 family)